MGEKKKSGKTEALRVQKFIHRKKVSCYSVNNWLIQPQRQEKLQKSTKAINCYKDKMGRNKKGDQKAKLQKGSKSSV